MTKTNINNYFIGDAVAEKKGKNLYDFIKNYMLDVVNQINGNPENVREVVTTGINNNTLFTAMKEKETGEVKVYVYTFSTKNGELKVKIKNSEKVDMNGLTIPKKIRKLNPVMK